MLVHSLPASSETAASTSFSSRPNYLRTVSNSSHSQDGHLLEYLLDFLADDERPTLVIESATSGPADVPLPAPRVVFENAAFTALTENPDYRPTYEQWLKSFNTGGISLTSKTAQRFRGRAWSSKRLENGWRIIYCSQAEQDEEPQQPSAGGPEGIHGLSVTLTDELLELERVTSPRPMIITRKRTRSDGYERSIPQRISTWGDVDEYGRRSIDWTRGSKRTSNPWIKFLQEYHWERTQLGPMDTWPDELRSMGILIMSNTEPRMLYWGEKKLMLYNEAAAVVIGQPHPNEALGNPFADVWGTEILGRQMDMISRAIFHDRASQQPDFEAILERRGFPEETYWRLKFLPIVGHDGFTVGALNEYTESTTGVYEEQRRKLMTRLGQSLALKESLPEMWSTFLSQLKDQLYDVSYALVYSRESPNDSSSTASAPSLHKSYRLEGCVGVESNLFQETLSLDQDDDRFLLVHEFYKAHDSKHAVVLSTEADSLSSGLAMDIPDRGTVRNVCILPISSLSGQEMGVVVLGMNPRRFFSEESRIFVDAVRDVIVKSVAIISLPEEQRRQRQFEEMNVALSQQLRITALKAEKNEETFTRMAQNAPFGMYMYSSDGTPKYFNDAYLKLIGLSRQDLLEEAEKGLAWRNTVYEPDLDFVLRTWQGLTVAKTPTKFEYRVKQDTSPRRSGDANNFRWLEAISFPELDEDNRVVTVQGWLTDISHRKLTESLMAQRLQDALETKRASTRFIDMVSHEMRNPLSAILQLADGILNSMEVPVKGKSLALTAETADHIIDSAQTVMLCAQHQKTIIDDILTISKLDSNLLVISPDKVKAPEIIGRALKMYEAELQRADIEASVQIDQSYNELDIDWVMLDPGRLLQVIINLLTNAIKFTRDSETRRITASLSASVTPPTGANHHLEYIKQRVTKTNTLSTAPEWGPGEEVYLEFAVTDSGKGLTEDEMKILFHRFAQASPKTYKQYGGSGLGLFISKELTELQGGQIGVIGQANAGCTFAFYVKARRCPNAPSRRESQALRPSISQTGSEAKVTAQSNGTHRLARTISGSSAGGKTSVGDLHILIVEDNKINQKVMSAQLKRLGCTVYTADHGLDALNFLNTTSFFRGQDRLQLSLVLMDLEMPIMDGLTCVRRIRQLQRSQEIITHVPVIAITANARSEQIETALEAGMDDVVTKPFRIPDLVPRMQNLVSRTTAVD